jgi:hypothetical protein
MSLGNEPLQLWIKPTKSKKGLFAWDVYLMIRNSVWHRGGYADTYEKCCKDALKTMRKIYKEATDYGSAYRPSQF